MRIEQAMNVFKSNRHIVTLGNFPVLSKLYNRTGKMLLVYEQLLLTRWKEKIEAWKDHLNANLLCLLNNDDDPTSIVNARIVINSNLDLFSIFDEVKWFRRLDVDIPKAALICMEKVVERSVTMTQERTTVCLSVRVCACPIRSKHSSTTNRYSTIFSRVFTDCNNESIGRSIRCSSSKFVRCIGRSSPACTH
jgi:hypothetical protein